MVSNNQTVYIAGGAVVRGVVRPDEPYRISRYSGLRNYSPTFVLQGTNITFRGRGIVDGSLCLTHARNLMLVQGRNIRLEESPRLISLWIDKASWTRDVERGHIDGVVFQNIQAIAQPLRVELKGFDDTHAIENVSFQSVVVNGKPLTPADVRKSAFVRNVAVLP